jgi:hypothetical protein
MAKERPLTDQQMEAMQMAFAEPTLYGDCKIIEGFGRSIRGLRNRELVDGEFPHIYLTPKGIAMMETENA